MTTDSTPISLRIPGIPIEGTAHTIPDELKDVFTIRSIQIFQISSAREGTAEASEIESLPNDVVEVELGDGTRFWTTQECLRNEILHPTGSRGAEDGILELPASLPARSGTRGFMGKVVIKTLRNTCHC